MLAMSVPVFEVGLFCEKTFKPVLEFLAEKGFPPPFEWPNKIPLIRGLRDSSRFPLALESGTDRDQNSEVWLDSKEIEALGLKPKDVTYCLPITSHMAGATLNFSEDLVLVYNPTCLVRINNLPSERYIYRCVSEKTFKDALMFGIRQII